MAWQLNVQTCEPQDSTKQLRALSPAQVFRLALAQGQGASAGRAAQCLVRASLREAEPDHTDWLIESGGEALVMSGKVFVAGEKVTPEYMAYLSSTLRWAF